MNGGSEVDENIIESVEEDVNINNKNNATNFMKIFQKIISAALGGLTVSLLGFYFNNFNIKRNDNNINNII